MARTRVDLSRSGGSSFTHNVLDSSA